MSTLTWTCWRDANHEIGIHPTYGWPQCVECGAAPDYHERPAFLDERFELTIYVFEGGLHEGIVAPRSGIVGLPLGKERAVIYFEGWTNGPMQYADRDPRGLWEAGIEHAASRMVCQYPTSAMASPRLEILVPIGTYNPASHVITVTNEEALESWLTTP